MRTFLKGFVALLFCFLTIVPFIAESASWLDDFQYRKQITLNNPNSSMLQNYPIRLVLHATSGTDSGSDLYIGNVVQADFADIRFTANDEETQLDYWIESIDTGTAVVWIAVTEMAASANTVIYLYYGNETADSMSNGTDTFSFFDDFDTNGIDNWTASTQGENHAEETGNQDQMVNTSTFVSAPHSAQLQTYASCFSGPFDGVASLLEISSNLPEDDYQVDFSVKRDITGFRFVTSAYQESKVLINNNTEFDQNTTCAGSGCTTATAWLDGSFTLDDTAIDTLTLRGYSGDCTDGNVYFDSVRIRQRATEDPEVVGTGSQETPPTPTVTPTTIPTPLPTEIPTPTPTIPVISPTPQETKASACFYTVENGDTRWGIAAAAYGDGHKYLDLIDQNKKTFPHITTTLKVGWNLAVPCENYPFFTIKSYTQPAPLISPTPSGEPEQPIDDKNQNTPDETLPENESPFQFYDVLIKVENNGQPLDGIPVEIHSDPQFGTTDETGHVRFANISAGKHTVVISYNGQRIERDIIVDGQDKEYDMVINLTIQESLPQWVWLIIVIALLVTVAILYRSRRN